jgi:hypothetical protein
MFLVSGTTLRDSRHMTAACGSCPPYGSELRHSVRSSTRRRMVPPASRCRCRRTLLVRRGPLVGASRPQRATARVRHRKRAVRALSGRGRAAGPGPRGGPRAGPERGGGGGQPGQALAGGGRPAGRHRPAGRQREAGMHRQAGTGRHRAGVGTAKRPAPGIGASRGHIVRS